MMCSRLAKMQSFWPHPFRMRLGLISFCAFCHSCCLGHVILSSGHLQWLEISFLCNSYCWFPCLLHVPMYTCLWVFIYLWDLTLQCLILLLRFALFSLQFQTNISASYFSWITWFLIWSIKKRKTKTPNNTFIGNLPGFLIKPTFSP